MQLGKINHLTIQRFAPPGAYLVDAQENEILLPNKYLEPDWKEGTEVDVFVMKDSSDRMVAVKETPYILLGDFAFLEVVEINPYGAFVDWGLDKDLFVPFAEQRHALQIGEKYLFTLMYDYDTDRLFASMKVKKMLVPCQDKSLEGQEVSIFIGDDSKLGRNVIVENRYEGLIYKNHITKMLTEGETMTAFVASVREDGKLDITLEIINDSRYDAAEQTILSLLKENEGVLYVHDKSEPDEIKSMLGMSKKTFKQAIGKLYKHRRISLEPNCIKLIQK